MAFLPLLDGTNATRDYQIAFKGYNHNLSISEQEFYDTHNVTTGHFPVLSPRPPRARLRQFVKFNGMHAKGDMLCWVDGTGFYYDGAYVGEVADSPKRFATMGALVLIWPDKLSYNTHTGEFAALGARVELSGAEFSLSKLDGGGFGSVIASDTAPGSPANGQHWVDTSGDAHVLKLYSAATGSWAGIATTYVKIAAAALGETFKPGDGVRIEGTGNAQFERLGPDYVVMGAGEGWITVVGIIDAGFAHDASVERRIPDMDFITQSENRLWGCSSANHEIYASKLGDPANWYCYQGLSTDSYAATIGTDGDFTGAATHLGYVLFFKERCIHKVFGSRPSNFQITNSDVRGVMQGADRSLAIVNETLYYLSPSGVCAYDGGLPASVSGALGPVRYHDAVAGALDDRYCVSMRDAGGAWSLFAFDARTGLWMREDATRAQAIVRCGGDLMAVDGDGALWSLRGDLSRYADADAALEGPVEWMVETGDMGMDTPDNKYLSRIQVRLEVPRGGYVELSVQHDSDGRWHRRDRIAATRKRSVALQAIPLRCDHFRLRLSGKGDCKVYSIAKVIEEGSEL